jgi:hypothetical protein
MHPVGGNGASQAIIDARVLARELALQPSIEVAIAAYDAKRRLATTRVVQSNRQAGPHRCQDLVEARAPNGFSELSDVVQQHELEEISADYKVIAGFDIESLNKRSSLSVVSLLGEPSPTTAIRGANSSARVRQAKRSR